MLPSTNRLPVLSNLVATRPSHFWCAAPAHFLGTNSIPSSFDGLLLGRFTVLAHPHIRSSLPAVCQSGRGCLPPTPHSWSLNNYLFYWGVAAPVTFLSMTWVIFLFSSTIHLFSPDLESLPCLEVVSQLCVISERAAQIPSAFMVTTIIFLLRCRSPQQLYVASMFRWVGYLHV